ncbi:hypothetical protein KM918_26990 [Priestia megaterium]|uniref:hypothetical protein n=1 Tax=Priestia megaterium TaxID=1404 RepID=UPI001C243F91|nr:hypothetical protein [Priestia megaterium]MBU8690934.1 hypothetical protein [Priestia megaterium]
MSKGYFYSDPMNPPILNRDSEGNYIKSQLERIMRTYESNLHTLESMTDKRKELTDIIERKETSKRSNYVKYLHKRDKTKEEQGFLDTVIQQIEEMYMALPRVERRIREAKRRIDAVYPSELMEVVYREHSKLRGEN